MQDNPSTAGDPDDEGRVAEWEIGLPSGDDLVPLSQFLVPPILAAAFDITPEPARSILDVHRASQYTIFALHSHLSTASSTSVALGSLLTEDLMLVEPPNKSGQPDPPPAAVEEVESFSLQPETSTAEQSARSPKRSRLVWTPQFHKRFVDVLAHLGIKKAVPKTIMPLMNVEGLTRENVASHLQKYRLYLKRTGLSNEGSSASDHLFASTPVPPSLRDPPPPLAQPPSVMPMTVTNMPDSQQAAGYRGLAHGAFTRSPQKTKPALMAFQQKK